MSDLVTSILDWQQAGRPVSIVRVVDTTGFSSRERASLAAFTPGQAAIGSVLAGALDHQVSARIESANGLRALIELQVSDQAAADAGLSCGGSARILVQPADDVDAAGWSAMAGGAPVCVVTRLTANGGDYSDATTVSVGPSEVFTAATLDDAEARYGPDVRRIFGRGANQTKLVEGASGPAVVTALWPVPSLVVVGGGLIAAALTAAGGLLEWTSQVVDTGEQAIAAITGLNYADAVVVLSHDRAVDVPALRTALASGAGYVGGLGSAHTQRERAQWLAADGVSSDDIARIHGPAGLDIGAFTPAEIATSITAEIVAVRSGADGRKLQGRTGPIRAE